MPPDTEINLNEEESQSRKPEQVGSVIGVPDRWWGFEAEGRESHPGACVTELADGRQFNLLKGSDATRKTKYHRTEVILEPNDSNGLSKLTAFSLRPRPIRRRKLDLFCLDRLLGRLTDEELNQLRSEMLRTFGAGKA